MMDSDDEYDYFASSDIDESMEEPEEIKESTNYRILKKVDIQKNQEEDIALLSSALSVSKVAATILLHNYKWDVDVAQEAWFNDENQVRESVGLLKHSFVESQSFRGESLVVCGICYESYAYNVDLENTESFCGHSFCNECLRTYISTNINDGPGCLILRCPDPPCKAFIGEDMVELLVSDEDKEKYKGYLIRSYVENSNKIKWCPAPDCDCAIKFVMGSDSSDVTCDCSLSFCWNCVEDAHRPVDCETVCNWILKNSSESENTTWILANSKPCPKCKVAIEKNLGCFHMTCRQCHFEFCWICLSPYRSHDTSTCNRFKADIESGASKEEMLRQRAKKFLLRYAHYFERWAENNKSRDKALTDLREMNTMKLEILQKKHCPEAGQLKFVTEAWEQIVECRRVLKWSYAYGYYMPEEDSPKKKLFEFLQSAAESALEMLHDCAENELNVYFGDTENSSDFNTVFREKLTNLTTVTGNYFENFVKGMENGLSEAPEATLETVDCHLRNPLYREWQCQVCTFINEVCYDICQMCTEGRRGDMYA